MRTVDNHKRKDAGTEPSFLGYEPLKSQSKIWISSVVPPSKIFVWGA
jgi:hypothetical protein